jgi:hypothetical protein
MTTRLLLAGLLITILLGCEARLQDQRTITLEIGEIQTILISAVDHEQTIKVIASSPDVPINVHIYLQENEQDIERSITLGKQPKNVLAQSIAVEQVELEAIVPANKEAVVRFYTTERQRTNVEVTISN